MGKKNSKVAFNNDIDEELATKFEELVEGLPGKKYEIVEAAVKCFLALPRKEQLFWMLAPELQGIILEQADSFDPAKAAHEAAVDAARSSEAQKNKRGRSSKAG